MSTAASAGAVPCAAPEKPSARLLRLTTSSLLILIALVEVGIAGLMVAGTRSLANFAFLLFTLALLAAAVVSVRDRSRPVLLVVQSAAAAALLSLFWAGAGGKAGPSITLNHATYDLTLSLAGLLFITLLLARLLRPGPSEQACNCG